MRKIYAINFSKDSINKIPFTDQLNQYKNLIQEQTNDIKEVIRELINAIMDQPSTKIQFHSTAFIFNQQLQIHVQDQTLKNLIIKTPSYCQYNFIGCKINYLGYQISQTINECSLETSDKEEKINHSINLSKCEVQILNFANAISIDKFSSANNKIFKYILPKYLQNIDINNKLAGCNLDSNQNEFQRQSFQINTIIFSGQLSLIKLRIQTKSYLIIPNIRKNDNDLIDLSQLRDLLEIVFENIQQNIKLPEQCLDYLELSQETQYENKIVNEVISVKSVNLNSFDIYNIKILYLVQLNLNQCKLASVSVFKAQYIQFITNSSINTVIIQAHEDNYDLSSNFIDNLFLPNIDFKILKIQGCPRIIVNNNFIYNIKQNKRKKKSYLEHMQKQNILFNQKRLKVKQTIQSSNQIQINLIQMTYGSQQNKQIILTKSEINGFAIFDFTLLKSLQKIELRKLSSNIVFPIQIEEIHISNGDAYVNNFDFQHLTNIRKISISECCIETINFFNSKLHFDLNKNTSFIIKIDSQLLVCNSIFIDFIQDVQELTLSYLNSFDLYSQQDSIIIKFSEILDFSVFNSLQTLTLHNINKIINTPQSLVKFDLNNVNIDFENQLVQNFDFSQHNKLKTVSIQYTKIKNLITQISPCISFCVIAYSKIKNLENIYYTHINCHETIDSYYETENWWQKAHDNHMREHEIWKQRCQKLGHEPSEEHFEFECYKDEYIDQLMEYEYLNDSQIGIVDLSYEPKRINMKLYISYYKHFTKLLRLNEVNKQSIFSIKHNKLISNLRLEIVLALKIQYLQSQIQKLVYQ